MIKNREIFRKNLDARSCIGIFSKTTDSAFVEAAGHSGLDFIILDTEHGPGNWETIHHHVRAAALTSMASIVRVASANPHLIGMALDAGADGVQVPNITNAVQAAQAVKAARFHPKGERGVCRFVRAAQFGEAEKSAFFYEENEKIVVLQVEGVEGVRNIDEILAVEGFDVLFIGPYDLSQSVGLPGEIQSYKVQSLIEDIANSARNTGKALGIFADTPDTLAEYSESGLSYLAYSVDVSLFREKLAVLNQGY